jgi:hypothetical protein
MKGVWLKSHALFVYALFNLSIALSDPSRVIRRLAYLFFVNVNILHYAKKYLDGETGIR